MRAAVLQFPGSNCDRDMVHALELLGCPASLHWHADPTLPEDVALVVLPGGFSYGDYLRCGAIAAQAPAMGAVKRFADQGGAVLGICNGFQILCESKLLPGVLLRNSNLSFLCHDVTLRVDSQLGLLTRAAPMGSTFAMPIAHMEGNYTADAATLDALEANGQIVLRYQGGAPNGASRDIAGICNSKGNVVGLMPHPERAVESLLGGTDGRTMLAGMLAQIAA
jgi:phosphoribosylformylglycinamidine synthase